MDRVLPRLHAHARRQPRTPALCGEHVVLSYAGLAAAVERLAAELVQRNARTLGLLADNSPAWAVADLAAVAAGIALVPLPAFFSDTQLGHAIRDAGIELLVTDQPARLAALTAADFRVEPAAALALPGLTAAAFSVTHAAARAPLAGTAKITYTSGTTGEPKGVRLTQAAMEQVAGALLERAGAAAPERHLSVLPLATLLENIAGLYLPLLAGGSCGLPPLGALGVRGAAGLDAARLVAELERRSATSAVLIPQMLQALVEGEARLPGARFLAVGGAPVAPQLIRRAHALGLPVYEGYGLSECASVVSVNAPGAERAGSVGRPLAHTRLKFAPDGEILIAGSLFQGYVGAAEAPDGYWPSGDLGYLDADGFLHLTGRKKHIFITAFGRNVAPEWVERELTVQPAIAQAAVFGEARPFNVAVVVPGAGATRAGLEAALRAANRALPDYARVGAWLAAAAPFSPANGQLTGTGRLRRSAILAVYGARLERLYESMSRQETV